MVGSVVGVSPIRPRSQAKLAASLMAGALAGKVLGFIREIEMARILGASFVADSFRGALTATLLPISLLQGDMLPSVMIPLHRRWRSEGTAPLHFTALMALFTLISLSITALVWALAGPWADVIVGGFGPEAHDLTVTFIHVMALAMPASTLSASMSSIEISVGRSRITMIRASMSNIGILLGIAAMAYTGKTIFIAWGFVIAFNVVVIYGGTKLIGEGEIQFAGIRWRYLKPAAAEFYCRIRPLFIQPIAEQANILLERFIGSTFTPGTLASLDYARTLTETALYLVSQPIGYIMLSQPPANIDNVNDKVGVISRPLLGLALPASLFLCIFAPDIVSLVFQRGQFQEQAMFMTSGALRTISIGLWASTLGWILIRMINAQGRNKAAARVISAAYFGNVVVNLILWATTPIEIMGLGLGEATRGLTILIGASITLGCGASILKQTIKLVPALLILLVASLLLRYAIDDKIIRILGGLLLYAVGTGFGIRTELRGVIYTLKGKIGSKRRSLPSTARREV